MNGAEGSAGAVAGISQIRNPVLLARAVMDKSNHVLLCSEGAMAFARENGFSLEPDEYFYSAFRYRQWQEIRQTDQVRLDHAGSDQGARHESGKMGTIGAVARDCYGHLAAATSTGGMTNKRPGRVGDSPLIGCGTWASDETCAISCTGHGELFIRTVAAYDVHARMAYAGLSLDEAMRQTVMERLVQAGAEGGMIGADRSGNIVMYFNSEGMYRGMRDSDGRRMTAIYR
jgi:beta-aspartyl-peptidase (threonine type)